MIYFFGMVAIRDIDSSIPDPLDNWLMSEFDKYDRLKKTTKRACLATTLDFSNVIRWELNEEITEQAPRNDLTNSEEACREIREKLLAQVPHTEDAPDMPPEVESCVEEILDDTTNPVTCPKSGQSIEFEELETAMEQTSILSYDEVPIGFETSPVNGGSFTYNNVCWIRPAKGLYKIRNFLQSQDGGNKFIKKHRE